MYVMMVARALHRGPSAVRRGRRSYIHQIPTGAAMPRSGVILLLRCSMYGDSLIFGPTPMASCPAIQPLRATGIVYSICPARLQIAVTVLWSYVASGQDKMKIRLTDVFAVVSLVLRDRKCVPLGPVVVYGFALRRRRRCWLQLAFRLNDWLSVRGAAQK